MQMDSSSPLGPALVGTELHLNSHWSVTEPPAAHIGWPLLYAHRKGEFMERTLPEVAPCPLHRCRHAVDPVLGPLWPAGWHWS